MERVLIAVTCSSNYMGRLSAYIEAIKEAGGDPMPFPPSLKAAKEITGEYRGIVLSGGGDIDPELYGEEQGFWLYNVDRDRDVFEIELTRLAMENGIPILGICRGAQVLNVALGGTLFQDIRSQIKRALKHTDDETHMITIAEGSLLRSIIGKEEVMANSSHHQAVKELGEGLSISARSEDGVIEAIEHEFHPFALGLQPHPERFWRRYPEWLLPFKSLVEIARKL
jgi:putative glutamine amidotransferase